MGVGQALALQPGVSRSGVTITVGRFVGLSRDGAARFAFLMSLPITAGALLFKWFDVQGDGGIPADLRAPFVWGIVASGITGYIAVWGTLKLVRTRSFLPFVLYRLVLGVSSSCSWPRPSAEPAARSHGPRRGCEHATPADGDSPSATGASGAGSGDRAVGQGPRHPGRVALGHRDRDGLLGHVAPPPPARPAGTPGSPAAVVGAPAPGRHHREDVDQVADGQGRHAGGAERHGHGPFARGDEGGDAGEPVGRQARGDHRLAGQDGWRTTAPTGGLGQSPPPPTTPPRAARGPPPRRRRRRRPGPGRGWPPPPAGCRPSGRGRPRPTATSEATARRGHQGEDGDGRAAHGGADGGRRARTNNGTGNAGTASSTGGRGRRGKPARDATPRRRRRRRTHACGA